MARKATTKRAARKGKVVKYEISLDDLAKKEPKPEPQYATVGAMVQYVDTQVQELKEEVMEQLIALNQQADGHSQELYDIRTKQVDQGNLKLKSSNKKVATLFVAAVLVGTIVSFLIFNS